MINISKKDAEKIRKEVLQESSLVIANISFLKKSVECGSSGYLIDYVVALISWVCHVYNADSTMMDFSKKIKFLILLRINII